MSYDGCLHTVLKCNFEHTQFFVFSNLENNFTQALTIIQNDQKIPAKRKAIIDTSNINLADFVGTYYSKELEVTYKIGMVEEILEVQIADKGSANLSINNIDELIYQNLLFRFTRTNKKISGFKLDAARIKNIKFAKQ